MPAAPALTTPEKPAPSARVETVYEGNDEIVRVLGLPGRAAPLVLLRHAKDLAEREVYPVEIQGQVYLRSYHTERHFKGSKRFPEGLLLGYIDEWTDTGIGQPYVEVSHVMCGPDALAQLEAYANGEPWMSMPEKRQLAAETERWFQEMRLTKNQGARPDSKSPSQALAEIADGRGDERMAAIAKGAVDDFFAKLQKRYDLVPKTPKGKKGDGPAE